MEKDIQCNAQQDENLRKQDCRETERTKLKKQAPTTKMTREGGTHFIHLEYNSHQLPGDLNRWEGQQVSDVP